MSQRKERAWRAFYMLVILVVYALSTYGYFIGDYGERISAAAWLPICLFALAAIWLLYLIIVGWLAVGPPSKPKKRRRLPECPE